MFILLLFVHSLKWGVYFKIMSIYENHNKTSLGLPAAAYSRNVLRNYMAYVCNYIVH